MPTVSELTPLSGARRRESVLATGPAALFVRVSVHICGVARINGYFLSVDWTDTVPGFQRDCKGCHNASALVNTALLELKGRIKNDPSIPILI